MEELLCAEVVELVVDPVEQLRVALGDGRGNGVLVAELVDAHDVLVAAGGLGEGDDLGVVVGPDGVLVVLERGLRGGVGVVLLELQVGVVLGEVGLGGRARDHDDGAVAHLRKIGDDVVLVRDDTEGDVHVGLGEVDLLGALVGHGEVGEDEVDLVGLEVLDAVGRLGRDELHVDAQVGADLAGELDVIALVLAVLVDEAEGALVGEHADDDLAGLLYVIEGAKARLGRSARARVGAVVGGCADAAAAEGDGAEERGGREGGREEVPTGNAGCHDVLSLWVCRGDGCAGGSCNGRDE